MSDKLPYSSPQAYLNRFFRGKCKFTMELADEISYINKDFSLTHVEGESFTLNIRLKDNDTGADYDEEMFSGELTLMVQKMRQYYKTGLIS